MSIRKVKKDHLKEHAGVELLKPFSLPDHGDPLKFWTHHETDNHLVDLTPLAEGQYENPATGNWNGPFSGRPQLIRQLASAIEIGFTGITSDTAKNRLGLLRQWWRLLDAVEKDAEEKGQPMYRVEDVRQLTAVHREFAYRSGMRQHPFRIFISYANVVLKQLEAPGLYWKSPENPEPKRHLPPQDQSKALRHALRRKWYEVRDRWEFMDRIRSEGFVPHNGEEADLLKHWCHFAEKQHMTGKANPATADLIGKRKQASDFTDSTGMYVSTMRTIVFPTRADAEAAFYLCLAQTGWNPATLYSLDASETILQNHPRDENRYLLVGKKARSGGEDQPVTGLWRTTSGPGFIVDAYMKRIEPLREQLKADLLAEKQKYAQLIQEGASADGLTRQLKEIRQLEKGIRSVWIYVGKQGVNWLTQKKASNSHATNDGRKLHYVSRVLEELNCERAKRGATLIPLVTPSDFRDIFAEFVWRASGGNILALKNALRHKRVTTSERYVNNNILNAERDGEIITFHNNLFGQLYEGIVDATTLAHEQRYGPVTKEQKQRLNEYRALQRSRIVMGCRDPFHPPEDIQQNSGNRRLCRSQRCLLCKKNAVILPESLSGIAMRIEELVAMQEAIPVTTWLISRFPEEMDNCLYVLKKLFPTEDVRQAREHWKQRIADGSHRIPGIPTLDNVMETA